MQQYARHAQLFTKEQFVRIQQTRVLVAGAGGLGSTVLQLLTRYGFGEIHIYDDGILDPPDLNRQILYTRRDLGLPKADCAQKLLEAINPDVTIVAHAERLTGESVVPEVDMVVDCLDNFAGRLVLEALFFNRLIPIIHGGASAFFGQVTTLVPGKTPPLSEIYGRRNMEDMPGVPKDIYPPVVTAVASVQASEAVKLACGLTDSLLLNRIQIIDLLTNSFDVTEIR
ncbi:MAG: HesA/MoeB/ThiF family protein [Phycisphaerae bacterium]|nr:HesA/MoeB/ThiF family protein [Phycisphaerae bacterium]